ncbi:uncharacterized protein BDR25DRAFT_395472 [Lindgomyces ingoldianus]|uniref:Uncharacterized protein n=1 Tax=Lindgomyces ingoldianus TaxID=673940 RepID=A0ACB6QJ02_9PLEO|nr:uncharacterized protein BDR25DRAFT_395472 [Lindgomyces ingoldianus]KAF2466929.1 hypothetical protein BDR25DRAFT_395472 [Lindgomyces ingoldianus]
MTYFVYRSLTPGKLRIPLVHLKPTASSTLDNNSSHEISTLPSAESCLPTLHYLTLGAMSITNVRSNSTDYPSWYPKILKLRFDDEVERSEQVQQMGEIYERATPVISWLRPAEDDSDFAIEWILKLRHLLTQLDEHGEGIIGGELEMFLADLRMQFSTTNPALLKLCNSLWHKVDAWYSCAAILPLRKTQYVVFKSGLITPQTSEEQAIFSISPRELINVLKTRRTEASYPLIHLPRTHRRFATADLRDKVFALLALSRDAEALGLLADYRQTCNDTYINLAARLIEEDYTEMGYHHGFLIGSIRSTFFQLFVAKFLSCMVLLLSSRFLGKIEEVGMIWEVGGISRWLRDLKPFSNLVYSDRDTFEERRSATYRTAVADQEVRQGTIKPRLSQMMIDKDLVRDGLGEYCIGSYDVKRGDYGLFLGLFASCFPNSDTATRNRELHAAKALGGASKQQANFAEMWGAAANDKNRTSRSQQQLEGIG